MRHVLLLGLFGALLLVLAPAAIADWDHEVKWDQLVPYAATNFDVQPSYISSGGMRIVADDFDCSETGYITDIEFYGTCPQLANLSQFRITFWDDAAAAARPGSLQGEATVDPADALGIGWQIIDEGTGGSFLFKINLPVDDWFTQQQGNTYWIGIQGLFPGSGQFNWCCRPLGTATIGGDAVAGNVLVPPSSSWDPLVWVQAPFTAVIGESSLPSLGNPTVIQSADMSFKLTGTAIPEPATVTLLCAAGVLFLRRRSRTR